ncbi:MmcQ protein [uncultured Leuconostoc sp.]|uniref:MmcQ protein n=1 Tax=uncultured Leuconostoc sp. TaxID=173262 RepID=UPI0025F4F8BD|nr:MmcQ protein [uncultured Leuconostoc sp.]
MTIESEIFTNLKPQIDKLIHFGFEQKKGYFEYMSNIPETNFSVIIIIDDNDEVTGKIIDGDYEAEYTNFRVENNLGSFAANIKEKYIALLQTIAKNCFTYAPIATGAQWLVPANPKYFDLEKAFSENEAVAWKQTTHIKENDVVYLYVTAPISAIVYKCSVVKANISSPYQDKNISMKYVMQLHLMTTYDEHAFPLEELKKHGVTSVRGPRHVPDDLIALLK